MKHIFMTGATSGLGKASTLQLVTKGVVLIATRRNSVKGGDLLEYYRKKHIKGEGCIELIECDYFRFNPSIRLAKRC